MEDDNIASAKAEAEAQDYVDLEVDLNVPNCGKYSTLCHIVGALILSAFVVGATTLGIMYFG